MLKWTVIALAALGLMVGVWTVTTNQRSNPEPAPASPPSVNPFPAGVAATGIVEGASRNVRVAAPEQGLITSVAAEVDERVEKGDVLFRLDTRPLEAQLTEARATRRHARAQLAKAKAAPRPVSLPPLEAAVEKAQAELAFARTEYRQTKRAFDNDAATQQELDRRQSALASAKAGLAEAKARLRKAEAGTWQRDIDIARRRVGEAKARIESLKQRIERLTVRAPINGTVLKRRVEPGEYAAAATGNEAAMVLANVQTLHIRAQVDEEDAPRLRRQAKGVARVRGAADIQVPLKMLRIEPLAEPKRQLTGISTEVVDTRVIEVVFEVKDKKDAPLYPGMLVDVFIEGPAASTSPHAATSPR